MIEKPIITVEEAAAMVKDGMTILIPGFWARGTPEKLVDELVAQGPKDLLMIAISTAFEDRGSGKLVKNRQVKKAIVSYIGANKVSAEQHANGELEVEFSPQGTLTERVRCGGFGMGGFLTPTGYGTEIAEGKQEIEVDGKPYVLETRLRGDVAICKAAKADKSGNAIFRRAARNTNPIFAPAADTTILMADEIVEIGDLDPDDVMMPGCFVDYLVQG